MGKKIKKDTRRVVRSALTSKVINGAEAIKTEEALDYMEKQGKMEEIIYRLKQKGYIIYHQNVEATIKVLSIIFLIMALLVVNTGFIYAQSNETSVFNVDLSQDNNMTILIIMFIIAGVMLYLQYPIISSLIVIVNGFIMLTSEVNIILSSIVILIGIFIAFYKLEEKN